MARRSKRRWRRPQYGAFGLAHAVPGQTTQHLAVDLQRFIDVARREVPRMIVERTRNEGTDLLGRPLLAELEETGALLDSVRTLATGVEDGERAWVTVGPTGGQPDGGLTNAALGAILHKGREGIRPMRRRPWLGLTRAQRQRLFRDLLAAGLLVSRSGPPPA